MTKTDIGIYRGLKEKFDPEVHVGFFITTDTGELLIGDQSLGLTIVGWEIEDGVLTLKLNTGKKIEIIIPDATEDTKGLLSAADKVKLNALQGNLNDKVDKETGKSLIADSEIEKLAGLPNNTDLTNSIAAAKAAGDNAQSDLNTHKLDRENPHEVTKTQVGLGNVDNTSDADKPVSTLQAAAIADAKKAGTDAQAAVEAEVTNRENAIKALDATITSTDGTNVQVKVTEVDGKITAVNITKDDTAKASELTAEVTRAKGAESAIQTALDNHKADNDKKHIPTGGHERQILAWKAEGEAQWDDLANMFTGLEELLAYGVEWDATVQDPHLTRIGNMSLHKTLPIQSQLKGCIAQGDKVIYWLDEDNWNYKKGGNPDKGETEQLARLDGYDGTVRVYCPSFYIKSKIIGNKRQVWLSTVKIDNTWTYQHEILIDAYRSTVLNTVPEDMGYLSTLPVNSAISVVNTATYCRGGGNRSANDTYLDTDPSRSDLGKPRTYIPRASMRTYSRNANSEMLSYDQYKNIMYWLYVVEYANFNCQEAYNAELTTEGYHQGGMGPGVTTIGSNEWNWYNGYYPLTPCGYLNELGNGTGTKQMIVVTPASSGATPSKSYTFQVPRWRGFDNPFGDLWTNLDGIIIDADANNHPNNMNYVFTCQDPSKYADALNDSYEKVGEEIHTDGYTKLFDLGDAAHIIPNVMGGDTTKYKCDYHWTGDKNKTLRTLIVGGSANYGAGAGLGGFDSYYGVSSSDARVGFRSVSSFVSFSDN